MEDASKSALDTIKSVTLQDLLPGSRSSITSINIKDSNADKAPHKLEDVGEKNEDEERDELDQEIRDFVKHSQMQL